MWARQLLYGLFLAAVVALPSIAMLGYYHVTGDPSLRPLAQSIESVVFAGSVGESLDMKVQLQLHKPTQEQGLRLARQIQGAFSAKGIAAQVYVQDVPARNPAGVTFVVHRNRLGPYPLSRASEGINAAVSAYRMRVPAESQ